MKSLYIILFIVALLLSILIPKPVESRVGCEHQLCFWNTGKCIASKEEYNYQCDGPAGDCTGESVCQEDGPPSE